MAVRRDGPRACLGAYQVQSFEHPSSYVAVCVCQGRWPGLVHWERLGRVSVSGTNRKSKALGLLLGAGAGTLAHVDCPRPSAATCAGCVRLMAAVLTFFP